MPGGDGTGSLGLGARGFGGCTDTGIGLGLGCRRGFGLGKRYNTAALNMAGEPKVRLQMQKEFFERRLGLVNKQLEHM